MIPGFFAGGAVIGPRPWTPADVSTSLWLDTSDPGARVIVSGAFSSMLDKSGNGNHFSQSSSSSRPAVDAGGLNGRDVAIFDGSNDVMSIGSNTVGSGVDSLCVAALLRPSVVNQDRRLWNSLVAGTGNNARMLIGFTAGGAWRIGGRRIDSGTYAENTSVPATADQWVLLAACFDYQNAQLAIRLDGETKSSATFLDPGITSATNSQSAGLGGRASPADFFFSGRIAEMVLAPSLIDMEKVEGYLAHKWGLASNLPMAHPYKSDPPTV